MPGISCSFLGSLAIVLSWMVDDSTASAARRYERIRKGSPALISSRSAVSASSCAIERLSIADDYITLAKAESRDAGLGGRDPRARRTNPCERLLCCRNVWGRWVVALRVRPRRLHRGL